MAETLRQAGVRRNVWHLPAAQSLYLTDLGPVVSQGAQLVTGFADVPVFDRAAVIRALRADQAGGGDQRPRVRDGRRPQGGRGDPLEGLAARGASRSTSRGRPDSGALEGDSGDIPPHLQLVERSRPRRLPLPRHQPQPLEEARRVRREAASHGVVELEEQLGGAEALTVGRGQRDLRLTAVLLEADPPAPRARSAPAASARETRPRPSCRRGTRVSRARSRGRRRSRSATCRSSAPRP